MKTYEYAILRDPGKKTLDEFGKSGWELVSVIACGPDIHFDHREAYLKRVTEVDFIS